MPRGFIYVLGNPALKGLVKIGQTSRSSEERAQEISTGTGVPAKFYVAYEDEFFDCVEAERTIHERLSDFRESEDREFFRLPIKDAIRAVTQLAEEFLRREQAEKQRIADLNAKELASASKGQKERAARRAEKDEAVEAKVVAKNIGPRVPTVVKVTVACPSCSRSYSVTLKRGESRSVCPVCRSSANPEVVW